MKLRLLSLAVLCFAALSSFDSFAQDFNIDNPLMPEATRSPIFIGPVFGYNNSMHSVKLKTFAQDPLCPQFESASSSGFYAGFSFEYLLGDVKRSTSSIIARAIYNTLPVSLETPGDVAPSNVIVNGQEAIVNTAVRHLNEVKYDILTFEVCYKYNPIQGYGLGITLGPTFDFALTKQQNQTMDLIQPLNAQFKRDPTTNYQYANNDRTIIIKEGDIPNSSAFRLGIKAGVQYEILLNRFYVVPAIYYNLGLTNLSSDEDWRVNALQIGLDLRFSL